MQANLLDAGPAAVALHQPAYGRGRSRAHSPRDVSRMTSRPTFIGSDRAGLIQRASTLLLVVAFGIAQLVWVAALGYATYSIWQRLPL